MKKLFLALPFLLLMAFGIANIPSAGAVTPHPSGKTVEGDLEITHNRRTTIFDGEAYFMQLTGAPVGKQAKVWVDSHDGKGYQDFGSFGTTSQSSTANSTSGTLSKFTELNCASYPYLVPGQSVAVGNRMLYQSFYLEYIGMDKVSSVAHSAKDCEAPSGSLQSTGNDLFPYTLESVWGRDHMMRAFPDSYASGVSSPLKKFAGRFFDGDDKGGNNMNLGFEWYSVYANHRSKDQEVKVSGDKVYIQMDSTLAVYNQDTFISRLANDTNNSLAVFSGTKEPNDDDGLWESYDHAMVPWDYYLYPEHKDNAWKPPYRLEIHTGMKSFDVDDRGYVYFQDIFGFGIARDSGSNIRILTQVITPTYTGDTETTAFKSGTNGTVKVTTMDGLGQPEGDVHVVKTGGKYYAVVGTTVIEVTDPMNPRFVAFTRNENTKAMRQVGETVAVLTGSGFTGNAPASAKVEIYTASDFVNGLSPKKTFSAGGGAGYMGLAADKASGKFYSVHYTSSAVPKGMVSTYNPTASISVFSPGTGGAYAETKHELPALSMRPDASSYIYAVENLNFNNGYLVAAGYLSSGSVWVAGDDIKIWIFKDGVPEELDTRGFVRDYYSGLQLIQASPHNIGGKDYLIITTYRTGDVYELEPVSRDVSLPPPDGENPIGNGCESGGAYSTSTGHPCVCVLNPPFPLGTRGEPVKVLQRMLRDAKFYFGNIDGIYGPMSNASALAHCSSVLNPRYTPNPTPTPTTNKAPVITNIQGPSSIGFNQLGTWKAVASDDNKDDLSWSVDWGEGKSAMFCQTMPSAGTSQNWDYELSHAWTKTGSYPVTVYASDCKGGNTSKTFTVNVSGSGGGGGDGGNVFNQDI